MISVIIPAYNEKNPLLTQRYQGLKENIFWN